MLGFLCILKLKQYYKNYKNNDKFDILIDAKFNKKGFLPTEKLFSRWSKKVNICHICHHLLTILSGPLVTIALAKFLGKNFKNLIYTETGSIAC